MHSERFQQLRTARGPFVSIAFDDSHDTADAEHQLELRWRELADELDQLGASAEAKQALQTAVLDGTPPVGRSGRSIIATADGVIVDEHLIRPPAASVARVSPAPYVLPIVEHGTEHATYIVVAVDHEGADITVHSLGQDRDSTVDGDGSQVHKAAGAENAGYGDPQQKAEEAVRKNIQAVADDVAALADKKHPEVVFVTGEARARTDLAAHLPERVAAVGVELDAGSRGEGTHSERLSEGIAAEFELRRNAVIEEAAESFREGTGSKSGLAVEGLDEVCRALQTGNVETLIIGEVGGRTAVVGDDPLIVAANADQLSEFGASTVHTLPADEALPFAAINAAAKIVRTDERIDPVDGVAAILRYDPAGN